MGKAVNKLGETSKTMIYEATFFDSWGITCNTMFHKLRLLAVLHNFYTAIVVPNNISVNEIITLMSVQVFGKSLILNFNP